MVHWVDTEETRTVSLSYEMANSYLKLQQLGPSFNAVLILMLSTGYGGSKPQKTTKGLGAPSEGVKTLDSGTNSAKHIQHLGTKQLSCGQSIVFFFLHLLMAPHVFLMSALFKQDMVVLLV